MTDRGLITGLIHTVDAKDIETFSSFLDEDCRFRFGNLPGVAGRRNICEFVGAFFDSIASLNHEISESWIIPDGAVCHGIVSYTRHDSSVLTVPFANIFKTENRKFHEYLIFADTSQLYNQQKTD